MNKSERDKLRWQTTNKELLSLLNALDEADEQIITQINTNYKLLAQIDKAEARAEALERAIKLDGKCYSCVRQIAMTMVTVYLHA